ncbi:MAG: DUF943 family protein [Erwinia billingiae]
MKSYMSYILVVVFLFMLGCIFAPYILPAKVSAVYQSNYYDDFNDKECWSTIVLVDNPPFTKNGMLEFWRKEAPLLENKYKLLEKNCDKIYFGKNNFVKAISSQELKYWLGDNQICMKGEINGKCINNDDLFMSVSFDEASNDNQSVRIYNNKVIYIQTAE